MSDVVITFEVLFELLRKEKNNPELQQLDENFYAEAITYMQEKRQLQQEQNEIKNIKRVLKELWERRERKIVTLALNKARTPKYSVDMRSFLTEEKAFYEETLATLTKAKKNILDQLMQEKMPTYEQKKKISEQEEVLLRFVTDADQFMGPEMETFGPFKEQDMARLPYSVARILIEKKVAEQVQEE